MNQAIPADHFQVLGVSRDASEAEVRARYLELVKQYPPDREPEKFREIRAAYEATKDPLSIAERLIEVPSNEVPPKWSDVLEAQKRNPPRLSSAFLLSLGNRASDDSTTTVQHDVKGVIDDSSDA
jgi:curved DNA-binding protein CbpA